MLLLDAAAGGAREFAAYLTRPPAAGRRRRRRHVTSYGLALWAMTLAPVALVAALRETSILFATVISALMLKERITPQRLVCTGADRRRRGGIARSPDAC